MAGLQNGPVQSIATNVSLTLKGKLSSSFKKLLLNEHKNIFAQHNTGVFILGESCLKIGGELSRGRVVRIPFCAVAEP